MIDSIGIAQKPYYLSETKTLADLKLTDLYPLILEVKDSSQAFKEYNIHDMFLKIQRLNPTTDEWDAPIDVVVPDNASWTVLKTEIEKQLNIPSTQQHLFLLGAIDPVEEVTDDTELITVAIPAGETVYVEQQENPVAGVSPAMSKLLEMVKSKNTSENNNNNSMMTMMNQLKNAAAVRAAWKPKEKALTIQKS